MEMMDKNKIMQNNLLTLDCKLLEMYLCFRGISEKQGEVGDQMINLIAEFLEVSSGEIERNCGEI